MSATDLPRAHLIFQRLASGEGEQEHERWAHSLELAELQRIRALLMRLARPLNQVILEREHSGSGAGRRWKQ